LNNFLIILFALRRVTRRPIRLPTRPRLTALISLLIRSSLKIKLFSLIESPPGRYRM